MSSSSNDCAPPETYTEVSVLSAKRFHEAPSVVHMLLTKARPNGGTYVVYVGRYVAQFTLEPAHIANGVRRVISISAPSERPIQKTLAQSKAAYCLLSAEVESVESSFDMPLAFRLELANSVRGDAKRLEPFDPRDNVARTLIAEPRQSWNRRDTAKSQAPRYALTTEPVFYRDKTENVSFCAIDAWGFDSQALARVTKPIDEERVFLPASYRYSYLIANVHVAIKLANARAHANSLYAECMPTGMFALASSRSGYEMRKSDLDEVVAFIEHRLIRSLVLFNPERLPLTVSPFGPYNWNEEYQRQIGRAKSDAALAPSPQAAIAAPLTCVVHIVAHFIALDQEVIESVRDDGAVVQNVSPLVQRLEEAVERQANE